MNSRNRVTQKQGDNTTGITFFLRGAGVMGLSPSDLPDPLRRARFGSPEWWIGLSGVLDRENYPASAVEISDWG